MTKTDFEAAVEFADGSDATLTMAMDKSWDSFLNYFEDAQHVTCVTYSQSPEFIYKMFRNTDTDIDSLEVVVGDNQHEDYRKSLKNTNNATKIAAQLESLRRDEDLMIYTLDSNRILLHTKLYIIENRDGSRTLICGSANLSKQAWQGSKQTNVNMAWHTDGDTPVDGWFEKMYAAHREYAEPFMEDLPEKLDEADPDEESDVFDIWLGGDEFSDDPIAELNSRLDEAVDEEQVNTYNIVTDAEEADRTVAIADETDAEATEISPDKRVRLSPQGLETAIDKFEDTLTANNIQVSNDEIVATPAGIARYKETFAGYPDMNVRQEDERVTLRVDNAELEMNAPLPDNPENVNEALDLIEQYVETVGRFGDSRTAEATRAHFYEGLIYFCWAPFADYSAHHYAQYDSVELDKDLPFLFIHGANDSGKGMFLRFGARLISNGYVEEVTTGDEFDKDSIKRARASDTVFPYIVDDVEKSKIERDIIKSYWEGKWDGSVQMPTFIFTSNESTKPKSEIRTRMKTLEFNVNFSELSKDEREEAAEIAREAGNCNLFAWFAQEMLQREITLPDQFDRLAVARSIFADLYEYADRDVPEYVPLDQPAERKYDHGRRIWLTALKDEMCNLEFKDDGRMRADFSEVLTDPNSCWKYTKATPPHIRSERVGVGVNFESAERFRDWIDNPELIEKQSVTDKEEEENVEQDVAKAGETDNDEDANENGFLATVTSAIRG